MPEAASLPLPLPAAAAAAASSPASSVLRARRRRRGWRRPRGLLGWSALVAFFFVMNWWMFSRLQDPAARPHFRLRRHHPLRAVAAVNSSLSTLEEVGGAGKGKRPHQVMLTRLLALAAHTLAEAETRPEPKDLWKEPINATMWKPCSDQRDWEASEGTNGYIMISANGGINQQRVAICNAVTISRLLNATLVIPKFLYNNVWLDKSLAIYIRKIILSII